MSRKKLYGIREICDVFVREIMRSCRYKFLQHQNENHVVCGMYKFSLAFRHTIGVTNCVTEIYGLESFPRIVYAYCVGE